MRRLIRRRGVTRTVFLIGSVAIKFPSMRHGVKYFLFGALGNLLEHERWNIHRHPRLAQVYWCGVLGLWLVMKRYDQAESRTLTDDERYELPFIGIDDNGANVAIEDGKPILLDYGNTDWYYLAPSGN